MQLYNCGFHIQSAQASASEADLNFKSQQFEAASVCSICIISQPFFSCFFFVGETLIKACVKKHRFRSGVDD